MKKVRGQVHGAHGKIRICKKSTLGICSVVRSITQSKIQLYGEGILIGGLLNIEEHLVLGINFDLFDCRFHCPEKECMCRDV